MKCYECLKEEAFEKIKWSQVNESVTIFEGNGLCYEHLLKTAGWKKSKETKHE